MTPLSAPQTLERARTLLESGRGAALPELLKLIETLSLDISAVTIPELAELIEKDAVVLAKVLSVANMLVNNPGMSPLTTLSQAIHRIGYTRIRNIAVSLMLIETAGGDCPPEQREAAAQALCAGLMAQGTAEELGTHDGELAFACAALRSFGRIIMAAISPEHTREAYRLAPALSLPEALRRFYGLTPIELGRRVLSASRLPDEVMRTFRECEPESLQGVASTYDARLLGVADFGCRLSELALNAQDGADAFDRKASHLGQRFGRLIPGVEELTTSIMSRADTRLRSFSVGSGGRTLPAASLSRIRRRLEHLRPDCETNSDQELLVRPRDTHDASELEALAEEALIAETAAAVPPPPAEEAWDTVLEQSGSFGTQKAAAPENPFVAALAVIAGAMETDACWLFRRTPESSGFVPTTAHGDDLGDARPLARLREGERTVFGVCLTRKEVVVLHDTGDPTIRRYLPAWWGVMTLAPKAFALIPIQEAGVITALVLTGWRTPRRVTPSDQHVALAQQACTHALASVSRVRVSDT